MNSFRPRRVPLALAAIAACLISALSARAGQAGATSILSVSNLSFSSELAGTPSVPQNVTLTNTGAAALNVVSISVLGSDFSETDSCGNSVAAGASCTISVIFDPVRFGARTGTMIITTSAPNSPQTVSLLGTGMGPAVSFSSAALTFPSELVSTTSAKQTVVLTNIGNEPLSIYNIALAGPFSQNDTCVSSALDAGASCTIDVYFTPLTGGTATGDVSITDSAVPALQTIALNGTGADFALSLSPSSNSAMAGQSAGYTVSVNAIGGFSGTVTLGCGGEPSGASCSFSPGSIVVAGSSAATSDLAVSTAGFARVPPGRSLRRMPPAALEIRQCLWCLFLGLAVLALLARRQRSWRLAFLVTAALLLAVFSSAGCNSSSNSSPTVTLPQTYNFIVTGTTPAGTGSVQNTTLITLTVN